MVFSFFSPDTFDTYSVGVRTSSASEFPRVLLIAPPAAIHLTVYLTAALFRPPSLAARQIILLQLSLAPLRDQDALRRLQRELENQEYDLDRWREGGGLAARCDFDALDASGGWELAKRLLCRREGGRLRAREALGQPFFRRQTQSGRR